MPASEKTSRDTARRKRIYADIVTWLVVELGIDAEAAATFVCDAAQGKIPHVSITY